MRRIGIILAVGLLVISTAEAEEKQGDVTLESRTAKKAETEGPKPTIYKAIKGTTQQPEATAQPQAQAQPEASQAKPAKTTQAKSSKPTKSAQAKPKRRKKVARRKPAPEPSRTKVADSDAEWWEKTGNPVVFTFSGCVAEHAKNETRRGSKSSYPEFVTEAMNGSCKGEFDAMAQVLLDRHGEAGFRKIAKELIATTFIPAVKSAAEAVAAEAEQHKRADEERKVALAVEKERSREDLEAGLRQAKEAMLGCFAGESDRLASASSLGADRLVEPVIESCRGKAEAFFAKLNALYPDAAAGLAGKTQAVLDDSYGPAIIARINSKRAGQVANSE